VKFQTHLAAAESTREEPWRVRFSRQDASRYEYWRRIEFTESQWRQLRVHAEARGLLFLSSPFSLEAMALLTRVGVRAWKVPSGEVSNTLLLERMIGTGLPILLSTGVSPLREIDNVVRRIRDARSPLAVLQCTTAYPCTPEDIGLNLLSEFRERYRVPVGLSDHSGTIYPALAAVTLGASVVEVHVTFSREMFGQDVSASITLADLRQLVEGVRLIERALAHPVDKNAITKRLLPVRALFTKSVAVTRDLPAGTVLRAEHLTLKKPGTGIPAARLQEVVGRRLVRAASADVLLRADHLSPVR
jgi:N-acetylneuraminate synthase